MAKKNKPKPGSIYSQKKKEYIQYRSKLERNFIVKLDKSPRIRDFLYEELEINWIDAKGNPRIYIPDFILFRTDGIVEIAEVKPSSRVNDEEVIMKASAAINFIKENFPRNSVKFVFYTEKFIEDRYAKF